MLAGLPVVTGAAPGHARRGPGPPQGPRRSSGPAPRLLALDWPGRRAVEGKPANNEPGTLLALSSPGSAQEAVPGELGFSCWGRGEG